jgi:hypothetical protein
MRMVDYGFGKQVEFLDALAVLNLVRRPEVDALGKEVRARLERVMAAL